MTTPGTPTFSVVVPVHDEAAVIPELVRRLVAVLETLDGDFEIIFVDDGSIDDSVGVILACRAAESRIKVARLSRNFGHQVAVTAGLDLAAGDAVVIMDADLQDPPEVIPSLVEKWRAGYDVVYGVRDSRAVESLGKRAAAKAFYRVVDTVSDVSLPVDAGDFRLVSRRALVAIRQMPEHGRYLRGMFAWAGFRQIGVPYAREARYAGRTKYSLPKMLGLAVDGIVGFSSLPLRISLNIGFLVALIAFAFAVTAGALDLAGAWDVPGWAWIVLAVSFFGGVNLMVLGYAGRIHDEVKRRPLYFVSEAHGFDEDARR